MEAEFKGQYSIIFFWKPHRHESWYISRVFWVILFIFHVRALVPADMGKSCSFFLSPPLPFPCPPSLLWSPLKCLWGLLTEEKLLAYLWQMSFRSLVNIDGEILRSRWRVLSYAPYNRCKIHGGRSALKWLAVSRLRKSNSLRLKEVALTFPIKVQPPFIIIPYFFFC